MKRKKSLIKRYGLFLIILTAITAIVSLVAAHYIRHSGKVTNTFSPAVSIIPDIKETFDHNVKENVSFKVGNTDYPVYVRTKLIFTWKNDSGITYFTKPDENDYTLDLNLSEAASATGWIAGDDGYYYYRDVVQSGGQTTVLINNCQPVNDAPDPDYSLNVDVIVQTVQAIGYTDDNKKKAVEDAWAWTPPPTTTAVKEP